MCDNSAYISHVFHVLQFCPALHNDDNTKVTKENYFSEDLDTLIKAAKNIQTVTQKIEQSDVPHGLTSLEVRPDTQANAR